MKSNVTRPAYKATSSRLAKKLRKNSTLAEVLLWNRLKRKQVHGAAFHRQKPIGRCIVDFFCPEKALIIEIDGCSHDLKDNDDASRQKTLESLGYSILRFRDAEVRFKMDAVLDVIERSVTNES